MFPERAVTQNMKYEVVSLTLATLIKAFLDLDSACHIPALFLSFYLFICQRKLLTK